MDAEVQLLRAAKKGDYDRVRAAMTNCKTLNCRDQNGYTALHWAAAEGHLNVLRTLLESQRVNVHAKTKSGATALHWASGQGTAEAVKQLLVCVLAKDWPQLLLA
jgi:ankyrin repeat protein